MKNIILLFSLLATLCAKAQKIELVIPSGHTESIVDVRGSKDGRFVATASMDRQVIIWDAAKAVQVRAFSLEKEGIPAIDFSADNKSIAIGTQSRDIDDIYVYDIASGKLKFSTGNNIRCTKLQYSNDGKYLFASGWNEMLTLFDATTGKKLKTFKATAKKEYYADFLAISPTENLLAISIGNNELGVFKNLDMNSNSSPVPDFVISGFTSEVSKASWSTDGKYLFVQDGEGNFAAWSAEQKKVLWQKKIPLNIGYSVHVISNLILQFRYSNKVFSCTLADGLEIANKTDELIPETAGQWFEMNERYSAFSNGRFHSTLTYFDNSKLAFGKTLEPKFSNGSHLQAYKNDWLVGNYNLSGTKIWNIKANTLQPLSVAETKFLHFNEGKEQAIINTGIYQLPPYKKLQQPLDIDISSVDKKSAWNAAKQIFIYPDIANKYTFVIKNMQTGSIQNITSANREEAKVATISNDGSVALLCFNDGEIKVMSVNSTAAIKEFYIGNSKKFNSISDALFSEDGKYAYIFKNGIPYRYSTNDWSHDKKFAGQDNVFVNEIALSADGNYLLATYRSLGDEDFSIQMFETKSAEVARKFIGHYNSVKSVVWLPDNKHFLSSGYDGTIRLWNKNKDKELCQFFSYENGTDWVAVTPNGTEKGVSNLYFRRGTTLIPLANFYEKFHQPNLVNRLIAGEIFDDVNINDMHDKPRVSLSIAKEGINYSKDSLINALTPAIKITASAMDNETNIQEIRMFHNGKILNLSTRGLLVEDDKTRSLFKDYNITLLPGNNVFKAIAINAERTESDAAELQIMYKGSSGKEIVITDDESAVSQIDKNATLHLVVVGINEYKNKIKPLSYAVPDATAFKTELEQSIKPLVNNVKSYLITNDAASKAGIVSTFEKIKNSAKPEDVFVFYYAGHGYIHPSDKEFYLVSSDVADGNESLLKNGISAEELQTFAIDIPAQKQLFIMDACQSAGAFEKMLQHDGDQQKSLAVIARRTGTHWMAASGSTETAKEFGELGHGVFTYSLLEALKGKAVKNNMITVKSLKNYLQLIVPELVKKYGGNNQSPASFGFGNDFPVEMIH